MKVVNDIIASILSPIFHTPDLFTVVSITVSNNFLGGNISLTAARFARSRPMTHRDRFAGNKGVNLAWPGMILICLPDGALLFTTTFTILRILTQFLNLFSYGIK